jgi:hypothetical protein
MPLPGVSTKIDNDINLLSEIILSFISETHPINNLDNMNIKEIYYSNIGMFIDIEGIYFVKKPSSNRTILGTRALIDGDLADILLHYEGLIPEQIEIFFQDGKNLEGGWNRRIDQLLLQMHFD